MAADISIRMMTIDDYEQVYALWLKTPGLGLNDVDDSKDGIAKYLARNPNTCFVAEKDNVVVGVILCGHDGRRGYIHHAAVDDGQQRKGIGTSLVNAAMAALEREDITKAVFVVFKDNDKGNAFWEKNGFAPRHDLLSRGKAIRKTRKITTFVH